MVWRRGRDALAAFWRGCAEGRGLQELRCRHTKQREEQPKTIWKGGSAGFPLDEGECAIRSRATVMLSRIHQLRLPDLFPTLFDMRPRAGHFQRTFSSVLRLPADRTDQVDYALSSDEKPEIEPCPGARRVFEAGKGTPPAKLIHQKQRGRLMHTTRNVFVGTGFIVTGRHGRGIGRGRAFAEALRCAERRGRSWRQNDVSARHVEGRAEGIQAGGAAKRASA